MLPRAPSEKNPEKTIKKYGIKEINFEDVNIVREKLINRPKNLSRIVEEVFEVSERVVIYAPRFKLTYVNSGNYKEKSVVFDGVTSKRILHENLYSRTFGAIKSKLPSPFKK